MLMPSVKSLSVRSSKKWRKFTKKLKINNCHEEKRRSIIIFAAVSNSMSKKKPNLFQSITPIVVLIGLIALNVLISGDDPLGGANQVALLIASLVGGLIAFGNGVGWEEIINSIQHTLSSTTGAILILLMIGMLSGTWMLSGVIPSMVYYGLYIMRPEYFLPCTVLIAAGVSVATGSSWSTIATVGVALIGIGEVLGFSSPLVAGAIISGAYFGDKVSPLSDTTNLASSSSGSDLFVHIKYMMRTTIPTFLITVIIFTIISLFGEAGVLDGSISKVQATISSTYHISAATLLIPAAVIFMIVKKIPPVITLLFGALLGAVGALIFQGNLLGNLAQANDSNVYATILRSMYGLTTVSTGDPSVDELFSTGGMGGMLNTVWLILMAMVFGGVMEAGGFMKHITEKLIERVSSHGGLVTTTAGTCLLLNASTGDQYITIVLAGRMYKGAFKKMGLAPEVLSRTIEDAGTVTSVIIPWNSCGATQSAVLGVSAYAFAPLCFFCWLSPLVTILYAWLGKVRLRTSEVE